MPQQFNLVDPDTGKEFVVPVTPTESVRLPKGLWSVIKNVLESAQLPFSGLQVAQLMKDIAEAEVRQSE